LAHQCPNRAKDLVLLVTFLQNLKNFAEYSEQ